MLGADFLKEKGILSLTVIPPEYTKRWVAFSEALPPQNVGVILAQNDIGIPVFGYLTEVEGQACLKVDSSNEEWIFAAFTHWYTPDAEGLPISTEGLFSPLGLGYMAWEDTSEMTLGVQ